MLGLSSKDEIVKDQSEWLAFFTDISGYRRYKPNLIFQLPKTYPLIIH